MKKLYIYAFVIMALACKNKQEEPTHQLSVQKNSPENKKKQIEEKLKTYYVDTTYKYEHRTGESGHYEYNYDVLGVDDKGNNVLGTIEIEGKEGVGELTLENGKKVVITVEWIGHNKLEAKDKDGNLYQLKVD